MSWALDSGCTNHMMEERRMFTSYEKNECESGCITFDDNSQGQVLGFGKIAIITEHSISIGLLVESLDYNCYPFYNLVRCVIIVCSLIRV
jgi:hypothetical protein